MNSFAAFHSKMQLSQIILKPGKEQSIRRFHPWVFSGAIQGVTGTAHNGDIVDVMDSKGNYLATGHASEGSIAVRLFSFSGYDGSQDFWTSRIKSAFLLRKKLGLTDNPDTNIYRLVHAEGDGLPGLIIDIYGTTAVIQTHSVGMYEIREMLANALQTVYGDTLSAIYDRGSEKSNKSGETKDGGQYLLGERGDDVCVEYGCKFHIDWEEGQKTGYFIDQRENRKLLGEYSSGRKVLNTFCYTGGFSVYALKQGATLVHSLDSSQKALDLAAQNVALNAFDPARHDVIKADAVEYLKNIQADYDVIVLDPPAFAKHLSARHKAVQGYIRINEAAIRQIKKGGIIFTFSCSQVIDKKLFHDSIMAASIQAGRKVRILHQLHQPADHPISIYHPEGEYLKGLVLEVE
jgi:23S rRNA (cytosine1962-C5)-methyltransferase